MAEPVATTSAPLTAHEFGATDLHNENWEIKLGRGPVIAAAIHEGHSVRASVLPWMALGPEQRRREEDPLTGVLSTVGDVQVRVRTSRFEVDMNRPRDSAVSRSAADSWGLDVWNDGLPPHEIDTSLALYDTFYRLIGAILAETVRAHGRALVLDIHTYNHRRAGPDGAPADPEGNPDIDLGYTEFDRTRYEGLAARFAASLRQAPVQGHFPDVRENVRYEGGGHFPEWIYRTFGSKVCTISLEYKKVFMDEWTSEASIPALEDMRAALDGAVALARRLL